MKHSGQLTLVSLLSVLLLTLHLAGDIIYGIEKGGLPNLLGIPIVVVWVCGALLLPDRRSGYVIALLGSLLAMYVPYLHFRGSAGVAGHGIASSSGGFFFVWTLLALGVTGLFGFILTILGLGRSFTSRASS
jgi:hypothetical protein